MSYIVAQMPRRDEKEYISMKKDTLEKCVLTPLFYFSSSVFGQYSSVLFDSPGNDVLGLLRQSLTRHSLFKTSVLSQCVY